MHSLRPGDVVVALGRPFVYLSFDEACPGRVLVRSFDVGVCLSFHVLDLTPTGYAVKE